MNVLSTDSMRPNRLERHLKQQYPTLVLKTKEFFSSTAESLKRMRLDESGSYHTASIEIAFMIATQKKPHTIGEEVIKTMCPKRHAGNFRRRCSAKNEVYLSFK
ncbi:unnamed protein product [Acanthoscelides obtectus]|uniref:Uncharacterized protein n=1 Tax=Acanthoscelides obtectus TaxID=200917 RepID=A0A9P0PF94_ACAOB|nr:unnamed protein product [Acanthoscelides obtectus]CAK1654571.1 hypothetical protein AOBTE_LOCUS18684 [Acanthoscelides obtectus]